MMVSAPPQPASQRACMDVQRKAREAKATTRMRCCDSWLDGRMVKYGQQGVTGRSTRTSTRAHRRAHQQKHVSRHSQGCVPQAPGAARNARCAAAKHGSLRMLTTSLDARLGSVAAGSLCTQQAARGHASAVMWTMHAPSMSGACASMQPTPCCKLGL